MTKIYVCVVGLALLWPGLASARVHQDAVRQRAEQACYNNVMKFCNDDVPDETKIAACMGRNLSKLDPDCREIYQRGL